MTSNDSLFLDANVLFAAAYKENAGLVALWTVPEARLCSSGYAIEEARRNLGSPERWARLERLLGGVAVINGTAPLPGGIDLEVKDRPILGAAIYARATHLLTLDRDFAKLFGQRVSGVLILHLRDYLRLRRPPKSS